MPVARLTRHSPRARLVAWVTSCAVLAGACGGSTAVSRAGYIARADAICASALRRMRAVPVTASLSSVLGQVAPIVEDEVRQLRRLPRPHEGAARAAQLTRFLTAESGLGRGFGALARAARRGDQGALSAEEASLAGLDLGTAAGAYGLTQCGAGTTAVAR